MSYCRQYLKKTLLILSALLIYSCATPYQPNSLAGGYVDSDYGDGRFKVTFHGNGYTKMNTVQEYAKSRAKELCAGEFDIINQTARKRAGIYPVAEIIVRCAK
jgi:hypothetical protein